MRRVLLVLALVVGCKGEAEETGGHGKLAKNYVPPPGMLLEFVPHEQPEAEPMFLRVRQGEWDLRAGDEWAEAEDVDLWEVKTADGLVVEGQIVLPATLKEGEVFDNGVVSAIGEKEVWYGTFPNAVTVEVTSGPMSGLVSFGEGIGPIALQVGAYPWELASYELE